MTADALLDSEVLADVERLRKVGEKFPMTSRFGSVIRAIPPSPTLAQLAVLLPLAQDALSAERET